LVVTTGFQSIHVPVAADGTPVANEPHMTESKKPLDERWSSYPETVLHFSGERPVMIDLRMEVTPALRRGLEALGLAGEFAVLTAFNPRGVDSSDEENKRRMAELEAELQSVGERFVRLDACSPDKSHCECSVALQADRERAIDIARRFEQVAIFWYNGSKFWIYGAISEAEPVPLPVR
jgi:hypothetical protein